MPGDDLFNNEDFNLDRNRASNVCQSNQSVPNEYFQKKRDDEINNEEDEQEQTREEDDESESEEDFEEVPLNKSLEQINEERRIEMEYLGFSNGKIIQTINEPNEENSNLTIDINLNENEDNRVLIQTIRDLYKELESSHLLKVATWIKVPFRLLFKSLVF